MRRVIVNEFGGAEQLKVESVEESPRPSAGQVLVDVEAAGVNYIDVYQRKGIYKLPLPFTPGLEGVGRVREVGESGGENMSNLAVGQRVAWINVLGSYASHVLVPVGQAIPVPDSFTTAQGLLFQGLTAQYLVTEYRDLRAGGSVFSYTADPSEFQRRASAVVEAIGDRLFIVRSNYDCLPICYTFEQEG